MKKSIRTLFASTLLLGVIGLAASLNTKPVTSVKADSVRTYPGNGRSGDLLFVNGSGYFGEDHLAIYCFNSESDNAWSDKVNYRVEGDTFRVMIPYQNGNSKQWSKFIICKYNKDKDPAYDGWNGVNAQTADLYFSQLSARNHNTMIISGCSGNTLSVSEMMNVTYYYGIRGENHVYLDLSQFPDWEQNNAKFALFFTYPDFTNESRWSQAYVNGSYQPSFLWKVEGQSNEHLYEGIVPSLSQNGDRIWNMVIAVRYNSIATAPGWDNEWNRTQDLSFNSTNHQSNIIRVNGWNSDGEILDQQYRIADDTRLGFFGQYFLDTVTCSGTGNSDTTTSTEWNNVKVAYNHLNRVLQGDVWTATADVNGTLVEQAMARYDYIVFYKGYNHEDFINRQADGSGADHSISSPIVVNNIEDNDRLTLIIILASMMTLSAITLIVLKKYKSHRR